MRISTVHAFYFEVTDTNIYKQKPVNKCMLNNSFFLEYKCASSTYMSYLIDKVYIFELKG